MLGQQVAPRGGLAVPWRVLSLAVITLLVVGGGFLYYRRSAQTTAAPTYQTASVATGNVQLGVAATGPISVTTSMPLSFKQTGKVTQILVQPGQAVQVGQVLARQDPTDLQNTLDQAKSQLAQQQAALAKLQAGPTSQTVAVAQQAVDSAQANLVNAQKNRDPGRLAERQEPAAEPGQPGQRPASSGGCAGQRRYRPE